MHDIHTGRQIAEVNEIIKRTLLRRHDHMYTVWNIQLKVLLFFKDMKANCCQTTDGRKLKLCNENKKQLYPWTKNYRISGPHTANISASNIKSTIFLQQEMDTNVI